MLLTRATTFNRWERKLTKMDRQPIISAKDVDDSPFSLRGKKLNAIRKCSLDLYDGETLAIVGESGSGKSVFTKTSWVC